MLKGDLYQENRIVSRLNLDVKKNRFYYNEDFVKSPDGRSIRILSEYYGKEKARMNILIGFSAFLFMTLLMVITIGFQPSDADWVQESLSNVFTPMTRFFIASMIAYLISQYFDVWFFNYLKQALSDKSLWLRNNLSTITSSLVDNTVFSIFAWILLNPEPVSVYNVIMIYILGTYLLRIFIALLDTPFIYIAKFFVPKTND